MSVFAIISLFAIGLAVEPEQLGAFEVVRSPLPMEVLQYRLSLPEARPALRGWRAPVLSEFEVQRPLGLPEGLDDRAREANKIVSSGLARDGLRTSLVRAVDALGAQKLAEQGRPDNALQSIGFPVDWLEAFPADDLGAPDLLTHVIARLAAGDPAESLITAIEALPFVPLSQGFRAATESGEEPLAMMRLQLSRADTWLGYGDGSNVDLTRQMIESAPEVDVLISLEGRYLNEFVDTTESWDLEGRRGSLTLASESLTVAQWVQDNGKPGYFEDATGRPRIATLIPRYASRGEDGTTLVPGESFLVDGIAQTGHELVRSKLLFQGGNTLVVRDPKKGERVLLLGEAEVLRNTALGLTREQVLAAFNTEFHTDRSVVLPAASFHIDAEVTFRVHGSELIAFVGDKLAAARLIVECGIDVLEREESFETPEALARTREALAEGRLPDLINELGRALTSEAVRPGEYPGAFARAFQSGPTDAGPANLLCFLTAMDFLMSEFAANATGLDPESQVYMRSFERGRQARRELALRLAENGWRQVRVPSFSEDAQSLNYVNAIHDRSRSWIPAYGGLYERVDLAARSVYEEVLGSNVRVIPILSAESQRRNGAVHCSVSAYPAVPRR